MEILDNKHIHGKNLRDYTAKQRGIKRKTFNRLMEEYFRYREKIAAVDFLTEDGLREYVSALNTYRAAAVPVFDSLDNNGQVALGYTIMEEFFYLLFQKKVESMNVEHENLFIGKGNSYVSLSFTPASFGELFSNPKAYIHTKDQDFVLGANVEIMIKADGEQETTTTVIPAVAIECKTYLERNMLDSCAATASRLKTAMPYCIYIVASEYMKMSDAAPELTDIDEVYILCRAKNADRERRKRENLPLFDIDADLIIDLYNRVSRHLNAIWWKPEDAVENGKIINRPI
ncbi:MULTISPECIES: Bpu10I family restriction endonuclease [Bacillota]|jgi:bpu10I restriction endonuclease beta subunit|uniref:Bpu10I family restriction endonuclease n=1 Tax=Bacillota TaxID=1239 RepID=UPI002803FE2B|nr:MULTISPECIES: Bpu10I family restriction endonuclease [Bacillota]